MFTHTNAHQEEMRAQRNLNAFTDQNTAADVFGATRPRTNDAETAQPAATGSAIGRFIKAITPDRQRVTDDAVQTPVGSTGQPAAECC